MKRRRIVWLSGSGVISGALVLAVLQHASSTDATVADVAAPASDLRDERPVPVPRDFAAVLSAPPAASFPNKAQVAESGEGKSAREQNNADARMEALAMRDPAAALSEALARVDENDRRMLLRSVLRGWARADSFAAAKWALKQTYLERDEALRALLQSAVSQPTEAVRLVRELARTNTAEAEAYRAALVSALCGSGQYENAARFAAGGERGHSLEQLGEIYLRWSEQAPEAAWQSAWTLENGEARFAALEKTIYAWSRSNPNALAEKARQSTSGPERTLALTMALRSWLDHDLDAASAWLLRWEPTGSLAALDIDLLLEQ